MAVHTPGFATNLPKEVIDQNDCSMQKEKKVVYIQPGQWGQLFDDSPSSEGDNRLNPTNQLRAFAASKGYELLQANSMQSLQNFEYLIVFEVPPLDQLKQLSQYPVEKLILFLWEPPSVLEHNYNTEHHRYFSKIYTWNDDLVDNKKYFKFYYPFLHAMDKDFLDFDQKKLCTLISCNKNSLHPNELYSERKKIIDFFESTHSDDFDLYGTLWPSSYKTYKGTVPSKIKCLKKYRFGFAYENIKNIRGYVTEKIFDCFWAGCIPVYLGASNISQYIPKDCFIARENFKTEKELYEFMKDMDRVTYLKYRDNIQTFLDSKQAHLYSIDHFITIFMNLITTPPLNEKHI